MKYKVGDKVRIKSIDWYNENKDENGNVHCGDKVFDNYMSVFCGNVVTIGGVYPYTAYDIQEDMHCRAWTDEMIEGHYEEENIDCEKCGLTRNSIRCLFMNNCPYNKQKNIIEIPEDYVIKDENGNVINTHKIVLEKKKKEYPKTYEECSLINGCEGRISLSIIGKFTKLINARNAYWRVAGKEMDLGKPWKPDWANQKLPKYCIAGVEGQIKTVERYIVNTILAFPTAEMRDAFYENFKELIEIVKELL